MSDLQVQITALTQDIAASLSRSDDELTMTLIDKRRELIDSFIAKHDVSTDVHAFVESILSQDQVIIKVMTDNMNEVANAISLLGKRNKASDSYNKNRGGY